MESQKLKGDIARWKRHKIRILAIAGQRKAGKDVLWKYILKHYRGFFHVRIAEAPYLVAKVLELPPDRRIYHALAGVNKILYPILKESAYKRRAAKIIDRVKPRFVVVEALRTKEEYEEFVVKRGGVLLGVTSSPEVRYRRALADASKNQDKGDEGRLTYAGFLKRESHWIEKSIRWIVKRAHFSVHNDYQSPRLYHEKVEEIMRELGFKKGR